MLKTRIVSVFVLLAMLLAFVPNMALAAEPLPPEAQIGSDETPQPAPPPPDDVKVYTVTGNSRAVLSSPSGGYAVMTVIMGYYQSGSQTFARAGGKIDLIRGASQADVYAYFYSASGAYSPIVRCNAQGNGECTVYTPYYNASGETVASAWTTVYWSDGWSSSAQENITLDF